VCRDLKRWVLQADLENARSLQLQAIQRLAEVKHKTLRSSAGCDDEVRLHLVDDLLNHPKIESILMDGQVLEFQILPDGQCREELPQFQLLLGRKGETPLVDRPLIALARQPGLRLMIFDGPVIILQTNG